MPSPRIRALDVLSFPFSFFRRGLGLAALLLALSLGSGPARAGEGCAMADKGGCVWEDGSVQFDLSPLSDPAASAQKAKAAAKAQAPAAKAGETPPAGYLLSCVVDGCAGKRARFQAKLQDEVAAARKGEACGTCPFGVPGLRFHIEPTALGATVRVQGEAQALADFKARYDQKMAERSGAGAPHEGCGCKH